MNSVVTTCSSSTEAQSIRPVQALVYFQTWYNRTNYRQGVLSESTESSLRPSSNFTEWCYWIRMRDWSGRVWRWKKLVSCDFGSGNSRKSYDFCKCFRDVKNLCSRQLLVWRCEHMMWRCKWLQDTFMPRYQDLANPFHKPSSHPSRCQQIPSFGSDKLIQGYYEISVKPKDVWTGCRSSSNLILRLHLIGTAIISLLWFAPSFW